MSEDILELEQAKTRLRFDGWAVLIEGKKVRSYDELYQLATQDNYKDREFLQVVLINRVMGG